MNTNSEILLRTPYLVAMDRAEKAEAKIQSLESKLKEAMQIGTAYYEHVKQTEAITEKLVKALEGIQRSAYVQSSSFALVVHTYAQDAVNEWIEYEEWKQERAYQFCKHVEKEEEEENY